MRRFFCRAAQAGRRVGLVLVVALLAGVTTVAAVVPTAPPAGAATTSGYWLVGTDGGIFSFGRAGFFGSTGAIKLNQPIAGMAATPDGLGYWTVASDGGIFAFGNAAFHGSMGGKPLNQPIVAMAPTRTGKGYWLVASDGGIFAFGDAPFFGSMGATRLNKPIVDIVPTPSGRGYWMAASDGGIFAFGDAGFFGSTGAVKLTKRIQQMSSTPSGRGYWMVAGDGGIFAFGDAAFHGSAVDGGAEKRIVDMAPSASGKGYYITASNGAVYAYGDAASHGSLEGQKLAHGIISMVALNNGEPPVPADDVLNVDEDGLGSVDVLANDRDPDGGPLSIQSVSAPGKGGSATASGSTITYRPAPDMHGIDFFTYTVMDDHGNTAVGRVNVTVRGIDDLPRTADDIATGTEDTPLGIDVLANDSGLGDGVGTLTIVTQPPNGTASVVGNRILYIPKPNFSGGDGDSLRYRLIDTDGDNAEGKVTITVTAVNDLPVAVATGMHCSGSSCVADVLSAPGASAGDADPRNALIRLVGEDGNGEVSVDGEGLFSRKSRNIVFKPANNSVTSGQVRFEIGDPTGGVDQVEWSAPATLTFHYENGSPTALAGGEQWASHTPFDTPRQLGGTDPDGDSLTYVDVLISGPFDPAAPPIHVQPDGTFTFSGGPAGTYVITFRVDDGQSASEPATYTITVVDPTS